MQCKCHLIQGKSISNHAKPQHGSMVAVLLRSANSLQLVTGQLQTASNSLGQK